MTEFSNLLRQRLSAGPAAKVRPDSHPDADTLTAYVERLLPAAERNRVLEHLAACANCREVAALAFPDLAQEQERQVAAAAAPAGRRWGFLWTPRFISAAVSLATVVVIAGVIVQFREKPMERAKTDGFVAPASGGSVDKDQRASQPASEPARGEVPARAAANIVADGTSSNANGPIADRRSLDSLEAARMAPPPPATTSRPTATDASGLAVMAKAAAPARRDYVNSGFFTANSYDVSPDGTSGAAVVTGATGELPPAPQPRGSNQFPSATLTVNAANTKIFADMPTQNEGTQIVRTVAPPSGSSHWGLPVLSALEKAKKVVTRRAPAIPMSAFSSSAMGGPGQLNPSVSEAAAAAPALEKSMSGLEQAGAFRSRALTDASVNAKAEMRETVPNGWRISSGKLVRPGEGGNWVDACAGSAAVEFTTYAAHGNELWAGGSNAALLHSRDGGATCERITLGAAASGTIVRIDARGAVIQVKSSSGQSWSSQDGGKTWKIDE